MTQYDIIIAIEPLESLVGLKLMFWNIPGVKNVFTPGMKVYLMKVFYPKMLYFGYIHAGKWPNIKYDIIIAIEPLES